MKNPSQNPKERETAEQIIVPHAPTRFTPHSPSREQMIEVLRRVIKVREATEADIPRIQKIYDQLFYPRQAFIDLAVLPRNASERTPEQDRKIKQALQQISSGGEFSHITAEEWKERMSTPGERVLVLEVNKKVIGVNSYCLGPDAVRGIKKQFFAIKKRGEKGDQWKSWLDQEHGKNWTKNIIMAHDTFFDPRFQGKGLFKECYKKMFEYELSLPDAERIVQPEELDKWVIFFFVNLFEDVYLEGSEPEERRNITESMKPNRASSIAGIKAGASNIGTTPPPDEPRKIPLISDPTRFVSIGDKKVLVDAGYDNFLLSTRELFSTPPSISREEK